MQFVQILTDARTPDGNFYEGELRKVDDTVAGLLIGNGWAEKADVSVAEKKASANIPPVTLEVDNVELGVKSEDAG